MSDPARTLHLFVLLLTGLPVLALTQLWGGVEPGFLPSDAHRPVVWAGQSTSV